MDLLYINLNRSALRNESFVSSFQSANFGSDWKLHRFEAIEAASVEVSLLPGRCIGGLKGNYLSHLHCMQRAFEFNGHVLIAEDDTHFDQRTEYWLTRIISQLPSNGWDVLLTDVFVASAVDMPLLLKLRHRCLEKNSICLIDPAQWQIPFAGAGAYIINQHSKEKVLNALTFATLDYAFDLMLREAIRSKVLNGLITFPFLTTVSNTADISQVQSFEQTDQNVLWNQFRRLVWIGSKYEPNTKSAEVLGLDCDVKQLMDIMGPLLSLEMSWGGESPSYTTMV